MAELFQKDVRTINEHIQNVLTEGELSSEAVIRNFRITASDGKNYDTQHYRLEMILAVGYRVKSVRGTQFRQWATARLAEFLVKGSTMDDERLKNPPGPGLPDYFDVGKQMAQGGQVSLILTKRPDRRPDPVGWPIDRRSGRGAVGRG